MTIIDSLTDLDDLAAELGVDLNASETMHLAVTTDETSRGINFPPGQLVDGNQECLAGRDQDVTSGHVPPVAHARPAAGDSDLPGQKSCDARATSAGQDLAPLSTSVGTTPKDAASAGDRSTASVQIFHGAHVQLVAGGSASTLDQATPGPILADPLLALLADAVDDLERVRIATENRFRQLTRTEADSDGEERGFGLSLAVPEVKRISDIADGLRALENQAILGMKRQVRKHPLWNAWGKDQLGVGEKQAARLFAAIGDPYWNTLHDRPRTVSELWAYSGYSVHHPGDQSLPDTHIRGAAGVAPKRQRGQKANWSAAARMRTWLIADSCVKLKRPEPTRYRQVYDATRAKYDGALHGTECVRCGPKGNPAPAGSPLSAGHQHARAVRAISKEVLRDLWLAAREIHGATP